MILGLDIGREYVKSVVLDKVKSGFKVQNAACRLVPEQNKAYDPETITKPLWVIAMKELFRVLKVNPKRTHNLITGINGTNVSIKQITTMDMPRDELYSSMTFEARKHLPMDGTDAVIDFQIFGPNRKEVDKIDVALVACTKRVLNFHLDLLREVGLKPGIVDADPIALTNAFRHSRELPEEGVIVLLDIGAVSSTIVVHGRQDAFFTRDIPLGGHHFVQALSEKQNLDYVAAQDALYRGGVASFQEESQPEDTLTTRISVAERTVFDVFVEDIRRSLRYYAKSTNQSYFVNIYLSGGSASLPGLAEFIQEKLNVEVSLLDPFQGIAGVDKLSITNPAQFTVAMGLAIHGGVEA